MTRKLTGGQFLALGYLFVRDRICARDLPMKRTAARAALTAVARKGYATKDAPGSYVITDAGRTALAAAREEARREANI